MSEGAVGVGAISIAHLVVDASVIAKWFFTDEEDSQQAQDVRNRWKSGQVELVAPAHLRVEVPRALQLAVRDERIAPHEGSRMLEEFLALQIVAIPTDDLVREAFRLCSTYGVALYDALYCALAEDLGWPLLLADRRLYDRLRLHVGYLLPIWDWRLDGRADQNLGQA